MLKASTILSLAGACQQKSEVVRVAESFQPDVILYNLALDTDLTIIMELRRVCPKSAVVLWSRDFAPELVHQAIEIGARGFLSTYATPQTVIDCLLVSSGGELWMERSLSNILLNSRPVRLSKRQEELLELLVQGLKNKEIAQHLGISESTVKAYLSTMFEKVGAKDRFELALFGFKNRRNVRETNVETELRKTVVSSGDGIRLAPRNRTVA